MRNTSPQRELRSVPSKLTWKTGTLAVLACFQMTSKIYEKRFRSCLKARRRNRHKVTDLFFYFSYFFEVSTTFCHWKLSDISIFTAPLISMLNLFKCSGRPELAGRKLLESKFFRQNRRVFNFIRKFIPAEKSRENFVDENFLQVFVV